MDDSWVRTRWHGLVRYAYARLRNEADAEDVVQDALRLMLERGKDGPAYATGVVRKLRLHPPQRAVAPVDIPQSGGDPEALCIARETVHGYVSACEAGNMQLFRRPEDSGIEHRHCVYCGVGWLSPRQSVCQAQDCRRKYVRANMQRSRQRR